MTLLIIILVVAFICFVLGMIATVAIYSQDNTEDRWS
jgi:hypothetical protein